MFKIILVPTDGSTLSDQAVTAAIAFAQIHHSKIIGLSVAEPYPFSAISESALATDATSYEEKMYELAELHVAKVANAANTAGVSCETTVAQSFSPYEEIIKAAKKYNCDVIFMSSHGRKGLTKLFVGSETQKVLAHSTTPVLVFR